VLKTKKIVFIGAGSTIFGLRTMAHVIRTPGLKGSTIALVDVNTELLRLMHQLWGKASQYYKSDLKIISSPERQEVMSEADFVIISIAVDREDLWEKYDVNIPLKYGIKHHGENGGPGGMLHFFRNIHLFLPIIRDIEKYCPQAWVLNYTNPMTKVCSLFNRNSKIMTVGVCHQIHYGYAIVGMVLGNELGIPVEKRHFPFQYTAETVYYWYHTLPHLVKKIVDLKAAGINHFSFMQELRLRSTGESIQQHFYDELRKMPADFERLSREFLDIFGIFPITGNEHMSEYLGYCVQENYKQFDRYGLHFYGYSISKERKARQVSHIRELISGTKSMEELKNEDSEWAEIIMEGMTLHKDTYLPLLNLPNKGQIFNLPLNTVVETPAMINARGPQPIQCPDLPIPVAELCRRQLEITDLQIQAGIEGSRSKALQALLLDPTVTDTAACRKMLDEMLEANQNFVGNFFKS